MDQQSSTRSQMAVSRNALVIISIILVALGIIIILAVIFGNNNNNNNNNCDDGASAQSFGKPVEYQDNSEIRITQEETNNIAKTHDLATVEDVNTKNVGTDTSDLSTVEDVNRTRHREILPDCGLNTITSDVSGTVRSEDTVGETVEDDSNVESIAKSPQKKRKRNNAETSGSEWTDSTSRSSDFSSPTDKSH